MTDRTYPRHAYKRGGVYRHIRDAETDAQAIKDGWVDCPLPEWEPPDAYREWDGQEQVNEVPDVPSESADTSLPEPLKKKPGRPKKAMQETS